MTAAPVPPMPASPAVAAALVPATGDETDAALRTYARAKLVVARALREARAMLERLDAGGGARLHDLLSRLAEDHFNLVVLGQFKRGKSSLINAIVGRELLPTATVPLTSVMITALRYGPLERAVIRRQGFVLPEEIPLARLADYITERGNPRNEKRVLSAEIEVPAAFLRRGLRFIDTPGVGSVHEHNTATTYSFLPECDAAIFVTSADSPLTDVELAFLDAIRQHVRKVFFVLNKVDQLDASERAEALAFAEQTLAARLGVPSVRVLPLSAREALLARAGGDAARLAASGLPALEATLAEVLTRERGTVFLLAMLDRALAALDQARRRLELGRRARRRSAHEIQAALDELARQRQEIQQRQRAIVERARAQGEQWVAGVLEPALRLFVEQTGAALEPELRAQEHACRALHPDERYLQLRHWTRAWIVERAASWQAVHAAEVEAAAQAVAAAARPELAALVAAAGWAGGGLFDAGGEAATAGTDGEEWQWTPYPFETGTPSRLAEGLASASEAADLPPYVPLPAPLARRLAFRALCRQGAIEVERAAGVLRRQVLDYLAGCVRSMDVAAARAVGQAFDALEAALRGPEAAPETHAAKADRAMVDRLVTRLEHLRAALLEAGTMGALAVAAGQEEAGREDGAVEVPGAGRLFEGAGGGKEAGGVAVAGGAVGGAAPSPPAAPVGGAVAVTGAGMAPARAAAGAMPAAVAGPAPAPRGAVERSALAAGTCPLCAAAFDAVYDFLCHWQYALATDAAAQRAFRAAGGFCARHTWLLERVSSPHGLSIGYPPLLDHLADQLQRLAGLPAEAMGERVAALLPRAETCAACRVQARQEQASAEQLAAELATPAGQAALERASGLCLAHLALLLTALDRAATTALVRHEARRLADVAEALRSYALKFEARRRELMTAEEEEAPRQALTLVAGAERVF